MAEFYTLGRIELRTPEGSRICRPDTERPIVSSLTVELEQIAERIYGPKWREFASVVRVSEPRLPGLNDLPGLSPRREAR